MPSFASLSSLPISTLPLTLYTYSASGLIGTDGDTFDQLRHTYAASGNAVLSGTTTATAQTNYTYTASAGMALGGTTAAQLTYFYSASGNAVLNGTTTATSQTTYIVTASGNGVSVNNT